MGARIFRMMGLVGGILLLSMSMLGHPALAAKWGGTPSELDLNITSIYQQFNENFLTLTIYGNNFDNGDDPVVQLGTKTMTVTEIELGINGEDTIEATLPLSDITEHDYFLSITTGVSVHQYDQYSLTISPASGITQEEITNWNAAFGWGDHNSAGYVTTETDPFFTDSAAAGIQTGDINDWNAAFGWGDHNSAGYVTTEIDPQVGSNTANYVPRWDGNKLVTGTIYDNGNIGIPQNRYIGFNPNDAFSYYGKSMGWYAIGWIKDTDYQEAPATCLSGWNGIKFFTGGRPFVDGQLTPAAGFRKSGDLFIAGNSATEWGTGIPKEQNAGKIAYQKWSGFALDIVGAGTASNNRQVVIYDDLNVRDDLNVQDDLSVGGTINYDWSQHYSTWADGIKSYLGGGYSDIQLKDIQGDYEYGLAEISALSPVRYTYKPDNELGLPEDEEHIGLIAQEVQSIIPDAVSENTDDGYLTIKMDRIMYAMLNAIKELKNENDELRQRIQALETSIPTQ